MEQAITIKELKNIIDTRGAVLVYFYSDSCTPCIQLRPKVKELVSGKFQNMELVMVNAEKNPKLSAAYSAYSFPVLLAFFGGKEFYRYSKYVSLAEMEKELGRIYQIYFR